MLGNGETDSRRVSAWLWYSLLGALAFIVVAGLAAAALLGTRPEGVGRPAGASKPEWVLGPGAAGEIAGGQLILRTVENNRVVYATEEGSPSSSNVRVRARIVGGPDDAGYGLVLREHGPEEFLAVLIGPDGYLAAGQMSVEGWRWRIPWQQWPHIRRGTAENLLRAQCRAEACSFWINDEFAFELNGIPAPGRAGPAVWSPAEASPVSAAFWDWRAAGPD